MTRWHRVTLLELSFGPGRRTNAETFAVLFDDPLVCRFTPIRAPFDVSAAERRIEIGRRGEAQDRPSPR